MTGLSLALGLSGNAGEAVPYIALSNSSVDEGSSAGTAVGTLSVFNGGGGWTFTEIAPLASSYAVASGGAVTTVDTLTAGTQNLVVQATNGTDTITRTFTMTATAAASAPSATTAFADSPKAAFRTFSDTISTQMFGFDYGYNEQGTGAIDLVDDPAGINGKVLRYSADAGSAAYVAEQVRFAAHNTSTTGYAAWLTSLATGHFRHRIRIASGSGKIFSTHLTADTTQATEQFSIGFAPFGSGFKFTVNGTAVGREIAYGVWFDYGATWNATADTLSLFTRLDGEGSWTTERSGAITAFAAPSSIRSGLWTATGAVVHVKQMAWSDTSFAECDRDFTFAGSHIPFTDQTRMSAHLHCPDGIVTGATQARLRWAAGDDPSAGATGAWVALSGKTHSALQLTLTGLTHNSNYSLRFEYGDAGGSVLKVSSPYLFGTTANAGTAVSAQYAAHCCYESTSAGHPFREIEDTVSRINGDYRKIGFLFSGDAFYEASAMSEVMPYRDNRPNSTEALIEMGYREFHNDLCLEAISRLGPIRTSKDDHESLNEFEVKYQAGGASQNTLVNSISANSSSWPADLTTGTLITRALAVGNSWIDRHVLSAPVAGRSYHRLTHGNIEFLMLDTRYGRDGTAKYLDDTQYTYFSDQIAAIITAGTAKLTVVHAQAGIASFISKTQEGWHNNVPAQADAFNDLAAGLPGKWYTQAGDVHLGVAFHRQWDSSPGNATAPANWLGEAKSSGGVMAFANAVKTDVQSANTLWKNDVSALTSNEVIRSSPTVGTITTDAESVTLSSGSATTATYTIHTSDTTAPTLSSATDTATGTTTATISVSTNEANGTLYWFLSTSATPPTAANLKTGTGAVQSGNQAVTATGAQTIAGRTGLTPSTAYYTYFLHRDAAGNDSTIAAADGFTTSASDTTAPILSSPSGTQTGATTANLSVTTDEGNGTLYRYVSTSATPPSVADLKAGTGAVFAGSATVTATGAQASTATGLTASTTYYAHFVHTDAATNNSAIATSASFTTAAGGYTFTNSEAATLVAARTDSPDDTHKGHIDNLVGSLKSALGGLNFDRLYVPIAGDDASARLNYANPAVGALTGTATFTSGQGLTGSGTNALSTGLNANAGTHFGTTSGSMLVVIVAAGTNGNTMGIASGSANLRINPRSNSNLCQVQVNTTDLLQPSNSVAPGVYIAVRTSTAIRVYKDGVELGADTSITNSTPGAVDLTVFGANSSFCAHRCGAFGFGAEMNATQAADVTTAINTYLTARGVS